MLRTDIMNGTFRKVMICTAIVSCSAAVSAQTITGSDHDLVGKYGLTEICLPCHTPHNSNTSVGGAPLWNHAVTIQSFTMYTTLSGRTGTMNGVSKLCLSCHDGVTAIDSYGGMTGSDTLGGGKNLGLDLTDDHPIGLTYPTTGDFDTIANVKSSGLKLFTVGAETDRVECSSCHNPHDDTIKKFLRVDNTNSALCLACHTK